MGSAVGVTPIQFIERRFARLYPAAIACALIDFALLRPFLPDVLAHKFSVNASILSLADSLTLTNLPFMVSALWTLPIELGFYLLIALLLIRGWADRVVTISAALIGWSALYLVPFVLSQYHIGPLHVPTLGYGPLNVSLLRHGCFFGVGMMLWHVFNRVPRPRDIALLMVGLILCWVEIIARSAETAPFYAYAVHVATLCNAALLTFTVAIAALFGFIAFNERLRPGPTATYVLRKLGLMTYPLYLLHEGVGGVAYSLLREQGWQHAPAVLVGVSLSLSAALIVVMAVEPWMRRQLLSVVHPLLDKFTARDGVAQVLGRFTAKTSPTA